MAFTSPMPVTPLLEASSKPRWLVYERCLMQVYYVYEPQYVSRGWPDDASVAIVSWFDRDLAEPTIGPPFVVNQSLFFAPLIKYQVFPSLFVNQSVFFPPRVFMVTEPTQLLKNEVRRSSITP